jgi:hypothetical protein
MLTDFVLHKDAGELVKRAILRVSDGQMFDFTAKTFVMPSGTGDVLQLMPKAPAPLAKLYTATVETPRDQFTDGDYRSFFLDNDGSGGVFGMALHTFRDGEEVSVFPLTIEVRSSVSVPPAMPPASAPDPAK